MGRGQKVKMIKQNIDQEGMADMFNQLLGDEKALDINIIKDKYMKLKTNIDRIYKLLDSFHNTIYVKVINNLFDTTMYKQNIKNFIEDCKILSSEDIADDKLIKYYKFLKEHKIIKDCIHICKNLIIYKKYIDDNDNLSDSFIKSSKTHDLIIFPFCNFDIKMVYKHSKIDESVSKYILIFLNMLYKTTYEIYEIITSPDIDISKFADIIVQSIQHAKKMIPRANRAFKKIEQSVDLLKNNFQNYYKDFVSTKNPTIILENFILDCSKENSEDVDLDLARQFKRIVMFYQKKSQGKIKDPRINQLFEMLNKNFEMLNVKDTDINIDESEDSDSDSDKENKENIEEVIVDK